MAWACCKAFATGPFLRCTPKAPLLKERRAAAVNTCRVPVFSLPILLGNDTGRVGVPPLSMRAQYPCFRSPFCSVTLPGTGGAVTIRRRFPCALSAGTARGSRPVGAGTAGEPPVAFAVTEGFTVGTFYKHKPMWQGTSPIAPSGRELRRVAADNAHGSFQRIVTSLPRPVSIPHP